MAKRCSSSVQRAWSLLRWALLWARKGGILKRRLMIELRGLRPKYLRTLRRHDRDLIHYGERELSFDKTPIFHVKMHRPASMRFLIPCITPQIDFDFDFEDDQIDCVSYGYDVDKKNSCDEKVDEEDEEGIDARAEEFIAKFYEQIKLQRQISYLQYTESNDQ